MLSAAHCSDDDVMFTGVDGEIHGLTVTHESNTAFDDVQFMVGRSLAKQALNVAVKPVFYESAPPNLIRRELLGKVIQSALVVGGVICKYGVSSGRSCGVVVEPYFAPPFPFNDCNSAPCAATWVLMGHQEGDPDSFTCQPGDSGGPWFVGSNAVGLTKAISADAAGRCFYAIFMSTDRIHAVGAELHIAGQVIPMPKW